MTREALEELFTSLGIDFHDAGFYDLPSFLAVEKKNAAFLENYAEYVDRQQYPTEYLDKVRRVVPAMAQFVYHHLREEGRLGACIDVSGMVTRMLDREGIWSYAVGGGATIEFPSSSGIVPSHFGFIGGQSRIAGHMWVRVPPFAVLDITLPAQPWDRARLPFFNSFVMSEVSRATAPTVEQLVDMNAIEQWILSNGRSPTTRDIFRLVPRLGPFMERFPTFSVRADPITVSYAPTKIGGTIKPLEGMTEPHLNGYSPLELYQEFKRERID
jgi:hypothetical protein